jgi:hypothetical protein
MSKKLLPIIVASIIAIVVIYVQSEIPPYPGQTALIQTTSSRASTYLLPVEIGGKTGYIDSNGTMVITPRYLYGEPFEKGMARVIVGTDLFKDSRCVFIDQTGKVVIEPNNGEVLGDFNEGLAFVFHPSTLHSDSWDLVEGKCGYIDTNGRQVIAAKFDAGSHFSEGLAAVRIGEKWGYIDANGTVVITPAFVLAMAFHKGMAVVAAGGEIVMGRLTGQKYGFIDRTGHITIAPTYDGIGPFSEGLAPVRFKGKWGYIDANGTFRIQPIYADARVFSEGLACVSNLDGNSKKFGFIDVSGKFIIMPRFDEGETFSEMLAPVKTGNLWGYIDRKGNYTIKPQFVKASSFHNGIATVWLREDEDGEDKRGYIRSTGKWIWYPLKDSSTTYPD